MLNRRKKLGEILIKEGVVQEEHIEHAFLLQKDKHKKLGRVLVEMGYLTEQKLTDVLSEQLGIPVVNCNDYKPAYDVLSKIPSLVAQRKEVFPLEKDGRKLKVAMADPLDWQSIEELSFMTGANLSVVIAPQSNILEAIEKNYKTSDHLNEILNALPSDKEIEYVEGADIEDMDEVSTESIVQLSGTAPIVRLVSMLLSEAIKHRASDLHLEPGPKYVKVRFRVDGELRDLLKIPKNVQEAVISRIKIISRLDITNRRFPQDGRSALRLDGGKEVDLRVSTMPTPFGEKVVIRILDTNTGLIALSKLGLPDNILRSFINKISLPGGMLLVTGPTGSGKSTTLYAVLNQLQSETDNIVSIEDPIEFKMPAITQTQVDEASGLTFPRVLRSIFRQDPDVILIGEIRDAETAGIAVRSALTGHYVFSTVHTNDSVSTITRMLDIGIPRYLLSATMTGVLAQRLLKQICPHCKTEVKGHPMPAAFAKVLPPIETVYKGTGCVKCNYTGYLGRIGVFEFLDVNDTFKETISNFTTETDAWVVAREMGTLTLLEDAWDKVAAGLTTIDEVSGKISMMYDS